ncbi:ABC transporter substrate-binding protein [Streptomyces rapamycinicus]|uniref:Sugar ABC transporter substrate-binding protein n=3 Tax=Streptomyces rapamycinicus TaxID=1226757 RepID=A0A0A0NSL8_STRRN|nr:extracellular solute-binding protein [Streptomyces rapamycinicus]AGP60406.1 sugar ABC transporter substrate-binding protein [Streptomyces rapamycinicus NRRL 5491]MBB4788424.1 ABC-type glycerol-3-phosphate transport system substrate-binding protein [Streptomyces rapamycinicus]RLV72759.1 sugar ABC transporter substrate-binding protein [Streptomyces rapamycinicus NRRL 5491]UTP35980.1 extracellular solute-binding protein [Streptomyces rapamycinicus NRRL 5491]
MRSTGFRRTLIALSTFSLALTACGGSGDGSAGGKTRITVNCMPPKSAEVDRRFFEEDIASFEKQNPDIDVVAHDAFPCQDPKTFDAKLAGGQMENVFYTYFTDAGHVVDINQAADLTPYVKELKSYSTLQKQLRDIYTVDGKIYGIPRTGYSMGLIYNRKLFEKAGLDPDKPPMTWEEVRADAKRIAELGGGTVGYADYSAQNQGGWHFTAELYSQGGDVVSADGEKATIDTPEARTVLRNLHDMRWVDDSMGSKQLLVINDAQQLMGSGKLGMYLAAPDNLPILVKEKGGNYKDLAIAPMPGGKGTLIGGDGYMFQKKDTPAQIRAGLKWLDHMFLTPGKGFLGDYVRAKKQNAPVGLPEPRLFTGAADARDQRIKKANANVPVGNYQTFLDGNQKLRMKIEPPHAQQIYSVLDGAVSAVLTKKDADVDQLLKEASGKIDSILARG